MFFKKFFPILKSYLKKLLVNRLSIAIFGRLLAGWEGYLFSFITSKVVWPYAEKILNRLAVEGAFIYDKIEGKIIVRKIEKARQENDSEAYDDIISNI